MRVIANPAAVVCMLIALANCGQATEPTVSRAQMNPNKEAIEAIEAVSEVDHACLAEAIYFEAGASSEARAAVAHVILNRSRDPRFPGSVCAVIREGCQFSYRCAGKSLVLEDPRKRDGARQTARVVLAGAPDITEGALFFHAASISPGWFGTRPRVGEIGGNVFYR